MNNGSLTPLPPQHSSESAIVSVQYPDGMRRLKLYTDKDGEAFYLENILRILNNVASGSFFPSINNFQEDCHRYFYQLKNNRNMQYTKSRQQQLSPQRDRRENIPSAVVRHNQAQTPSKNSAAAAALLAAKEAEAAIIAASKDDFGKRNNNLENAPDNVFL